MDATRIVGPRRSTGWKAALFWSALSGLACSPTAPLGTIGDAGASLLWKATFETGNLSEWTGDGQGSINAQNAPANPAATSAVMGHNMSKWAGICAVNPAGNNTSESYFYRVLPSPREAYYSAWFYVPSTVFVEQYLSLWHMRENVTGALSGLQPTWDVNLYAPVAGTLSAQLYNFPLWGPYINMQQGVRFPTDQWVQLEVFFSKSATKTGRITVWQNGTQIFDVSNIQTVNDESGPFQWNVGAASNALAPPLPAHVYVDDAAISTVQLGPDVVF